MRKRTPLRVRVLLAAYIGITLLYQLVAGVSLVIGFFGLRHQVNQAFALETDSSWHRPPGGGLSRGNESGWTW
ncbi:MAG TPA: hypothetical protein VNH18_24070 [Bryobacteraceae bacterium]|nr:hypothetical protein [Bryobacteraceae bacterium]